MVAVKSVNRGFLQRMAKAGRLWVKREHRYTDDYAFDNATGFGKESEFRQVYLREEFHSPIEDVINDMFLRHHPSMPPAREIEMLNAELRMAMAEFDFHEREKAGNRTVWPATYFRGRSGGCSGTKEYGEFWVHSNLMYCYEVR